MSTSTVTIVKITSSSSTTTTTTVSSPRGSKKRRKQAVHIVLSTQPKKQWADRPTGKILLEFIKETFLSKAKISSKVPINDFIQYYNRKLGKGWLNQIVGNLTPFVTFIRSGAERIDNDSITSSISFFKSKLNDVAIQSSYQQTKQDLLTAVNNSFNVQTKTDKECHPIKLFLTSNHGVKQQYNKDDWLLYLIGSNEAGKQRKGKLEYNVRIIALILYSIVCSTRDNDAVDILAHSLGANATKPDRRRRYLNDIAHITIKEYYEEHSTDDATATTASFSQSSAASTDCTTASTASLTEPSESTVTDTNTTSSVSHHQQAPTVITTNLENDSSKFNDNDNISPLTEPPSTTTSLFPFTSPLRDTRRPDWDDMSIGSPPPNFGSPTPKQVTKKNRVGPTPNLNTPSNKGNGRVLFTNNLPSRVPARAKAVLETTTAPASPRTPTPLSHGRRRRSNIATDRIRGGGGKVTIDPAKFKDDPAFSNYIQRFEKATNMKQVIAGAVDFLSSTASSNNSNIGSVTSQYNMLLKVAKPRKFKEDSKPSSRRRYIRNKSKEIHNILSAAIPDPDILKDVLSHILKSEYKADIYFDKVKKQQISVVDCIAIRMRGGYSVSNRAANIMLQDVVRLFKHNNMLRVKHPLPGSLRAKMGKAEEKGTLPVDFQVIRCNTAKEKTEMCVHSWIRTIPLLIEKLVATCIEQDKFEDSILFSSLVKKLVFGLGSDRGGGDLTNLIRLLNRMYGNCAGHSIPLANVEKAAEEYDVLAKTLYNTKARNLLQPFINDELCMFIIRFDKTVKCLVV